MGQGMSKEFWLKGTRNRMTCQATTPNTHLCTHTGDKCIIKRMNPTSQKKRLQGESQAGRTLLPPCPGAGPGAATSGAPPSAFTPGPPTLDPEPGPMRTRLRPCPTGHSQFQAVHPAPCIVHLALSSAPPSLPQHPKALAKEFGSSGFNFGAP